MAPRSKHGRGTSDRAESSRTCQAEIRPKTEFHCWKTQRFTVENQQRKWRTSTVGIQQYSQGAESNSTLDISGAPSRSASEASIFLPSKKKPRRAGVASASE